MENGIITTKDVQDKIIVVRGKNVLLDRDVAALYGVETKAINQAVKNNPDKFPEGYLFQLSSDEKEEVVKIFDHLKVIKFSPVLPTAFTSRGLYMLATILKSKRAVETTIAIVNTFANVQDLAGTVEQMQNAPDGEDLQKKLLQKTGELMGEIIGQNLSTKAIETEIELNFAVVKIRHKIIREVSED
jgi:hypothetical protein